MFSFKFFIVITLYVISIVFAVIGFSKARKASRSIKTSDKLPYTLELLSYNIAIQKNYPEKISILERLIKVSRLLKKFLYITVGFSLSLIYIIWEYEDYTSVKVILVFLLIVSTLYLYFQKKLLNARKETLDLFSKEHNEGNKLILNKIIDYEDKRLISWIYIYVAAVIMIIAIIII